MDTPRSYSDEEGDAGPKRLTKDSLINFAKGLYDLKSSNSLTSEDKFSSFVEGEWRCTYMDQFREPLG